VFWWVRGCLTSSANEKNEKKIFSIFARSTVMSTAHEYKISGLKFAFYSLLTKSLKTIPTLYCYIILKRQCYMKAKLKVYSPGGHTIKRFTSSKWPRHSSWTRKLHVCQETQLHQKIHALFWRKTRKKSLNTLVPLNFVDSKFFESVTNDKHPNTSRVDVNLLDRFHPIVEVTTIVVITTY